MAVEAGIEDIVSLLFSHGADVNLPNSVKLVVSLIKSFILNLVTLQMGATPLITAAGKGYEPIVGMLLDHSADFTRCDNVSLNTLQNIL